MTLRSTNDQDATAGVSVTCEGTGLATPLTSTIPFVTLVKVTRVSLSPPATFAVACRATLIATTSPRASSSMFAVASTAGVHGWA